MEDTDNGRLLPPSFDLVAPLYRFLATVPAFPPRGAIKAGLREAAMDVNLVADIGGGTGLFSHQIADEYDVVIVDEAEDMVRKSGFNFLVADAADIPVENGHFDSAISGRMFHHITDPDPIMQEVRRVINQQGVFVVIDMNPKAPRMRGWELFEQSLQFDVDFKTAPRMKTIMERNGFNAEVTHEGVHFVVVGRP